MRASPIHSLVLALLTAAVGGAAGVRGEALAKLERQKLEAVHRAVEVLRDERRLIPRTGPFREYRANLHVHSHWSHDSRGTIDEIVAAAKAAGTSVLLFNEHPADHYDFFTDGHRGMNEGVLLIPGAEWQGFLVFPTMSLRGLSPGTPQDFCDLVRGRGGLMFVSHLEERIDWNIRGVTGLEIYNTHADFKDEATLIAAMRNPLWLLEVAELAGKYPQETFSALQDYPADYLRHWDELCAAAPHTGIAANDAHQNVGLVVRWSAVDKARLEDALGKPLIELDLAAIPGGDKLRKDKQVGDVLFRLLLDPYENSLRHVGTHLLASELSEKAIREALAAGRAFVAFDWLADSTGFDFAAVTGMLRHEMGSQLPMSRDLKLRGQAPLAVRWRLVRNGTLIEESTGRTIEFPLVEPGNYRAEAWLDVAGERKLWVLSNPLYITPPEQP
jgi:hypothetical protein